MHDDGGEWNKGFADDWVYEDDGDDGDDDKLFGQSTAKHILFPRGADENESSGSDGASCFYGGRAGTDGGWHPPK